MKREEHSRVAAATAAVVPRERGQWSIGGEQTLHHAPDIVGLVAAPRQELI